MLIEMANYDAKKDGERESDFYQNQESIIRRTKGGLLRLGRSLLPA
jgi:hypothetical protein